MTITLDLSIRYLSPFDPSFVLRLLLTAVLLVLLTAVCLTAYFGTAFAAFTAFAALLVWSRLSSKTRP